MFVRRAHVREPDRPTQRGRWPFAVPCVNQLADKGLRFTAPVTFLVGDNGSGTVHTRGDHREGLHTRRLRRNGRGEADTTESTADPARGRADVGDDGGRLADAGRATVAQARFLPARRDRNLTENLAGVPGYWEDDTSAMSHGEGVLPIFSEVMSKPGFYVMDEPESALSFTSCLQLVGLMHQPGHSGAQVMCAPHSPILAATAGADVVELGEHGFHRTRWQDLELVEHWRRYLHDPSLYLRHMLPDRRV